MKIVLLRRDRLLMMALPVRRPTIATAGLKDAMARFVVGSSRCLFRMCIDSSMHGDECPMRSPCCSLELE